MIRAIVLLDGSSHDAPLLAEVRALVDTHGIDPVLLTVLELPESRRHAAEERDFGARLLDQAAEALDRPYARRIVSLAGDPERGVQIAAEDEGAELVMVATREHASPLPLFRRGRIAVKRRDGASIWFSLAPRHGIAALPSTLMVALGAVHPEPVAVPRRALRVRPATESEHGPHCQLWVPLRVRHGAADAPAASGGAEPLHFAVFPHTGLLVGLMDAPDDAAEELPAPVTLELSLTDARGLGLTPDDLVDGVHLCGNGDEQHGGWSCQPVTLVGFDADGTSRALNGPASLAAWLEEAAVVASPSLAASTS